MKLSRKTLLTVFFVLAIPLIFMTGNAKAYVGDGATPIANPDAGATGNRYSAAGAPSLTCLNCHASGSIDKSSQLKTGHRNMMRKVTTGGYTNWGGPDGQIYVEGTAGGERGLPGPITWTAGGGTIAIPAMCRETNKSPNQTYTTQTACVAAGKVWYPAVPADPIYYVTMDWFATPLRSTVAQGINQVGITSSKFPTDPFAESFPSPVILSQNINSTQNCVPCHTTGNAWGGKSYNAPFTPGTPPYLPNNRPAPVTTGDAIEPFASFGSDLSGIIQPSTDGALRKATWSADGVQCERCHGEAVTAADMTQGAGSSHHGGPKFKNSDVQGGDGFVFRSGDGLQICLNCHAVPTAGGTLANTLSKPSGGFLNSPHARYSGNLYTAPTVGADTIPYYAQGWPWASSPAMNKGTTGFRGDFSDPTKFNSDFKDQTYSITMPRIRYATAGSCDLTGQIRCQSSPNNNSATVREYYEVPTCDPVTFAHVTKEVVAPGSVTDPATQTDHVDLPAFTCGTTNYPAATYTAAQSSTYGQNKGCTGCHDVHGSVKAVTGTKGFKAECAGCHTTGGAESDADAPKVDVASINHPTSMDTPFDTTKFENACVVCHMPKMNGSKLHLFRISTDPTYSIVNVSTPSTTPHATAPDGTGYTAVWTDLDFACGQCHGGSVGAALPGIQYFSKSNLAQLAAGMHVAAPVITNTPPVPGNSVTPSGWNAVVVDSSTDAQDAPGTMSVSVSCGNGTTQTGHDGDTLTCVYTTAGTYTVRETVTDTGIAGVGIMSANAAPVSVYVPVKYQVSGTATRSNGTTPISGALLYLKVGTQAKYSTSTAANGTFTFKNVAPGTYNLTATKAGYTFANPALVVTVTSSDATGQNFSSTTP